MPLGPGIGVDSEESYYLYCMSKNTTVPVLYFIIDRNTLYCTKNASVQYSTIFGRGSMVAICKH